MTRASKSVSRGSEAVPSPAAVDRQLYSEFIGSLQLLRIDLSELSAKSSLGDIRGKAIQVKSHLAVTCPSHEGEEFVAEARLSLTFMADEDVSVGDLTCAYRIHYRSSVALTEEIFAEFSRRNVPLNAWPFLRETVMSVTQRFGWMGLVLPPFKVPAVDTAGFTPPPEKRVAKATPKKRKTLAESSS